MRKTFYYRDPLNDDFAQNNIHRKKLPENYRYISKNPLRIAFDFLLHHLIITPIVFLFQKIVYAEKIVNRKAVRPYLKSGFYLYGNHTRGAGDAFTPHLITFPRKAYIIVNPDAVSIPVVRHLVASLGGIPLPDSLVGARSYHEALRRRSEENCICIYPEAHIWPYYTGIRPFRDASFRYPAEYHRPVFCFTVTYQKRRWISRPKTTVYVDGPFFSDEKASLKENREWLRQKVYDTMVMRSENSTYQHYRYIPETGEEQEEPAVGPSAFQNGGKPRRAGKTGGAQEDVCSPSARRR